MNKAKLNKTWFTLQICKTHQKYHKKQIIFCKDIKRKFMNEKYANLYNKIKIYFIKLKLIIII